MTNRRDPIQLPLFEQELVDVEWVAKHLKMSDTSVRRLIEERAIRGFQRREGGWWLISLVSVVEYEQRLRKQYDPDLKSEPKSCQ